MKQVNNSFEEQEICVGCGFCCDGTLFDKAVLQPGEMENGELPPRIAENYFKTDKGEWFSLPCHYFNGKCSIYKEKKAHVCSAYRCKLLHKFSWGKISKQQALQIITDSKKQRQEILEMAKEIWNEDLTFSQLLNKLKAESLQDSTDTNNKNVQILISKVIIFNVLLTRFFKTKADFNQLVGSTVDSDAQSI